MSDAALDLMEYSTDALARAAYDKHILVPIMTTNSAPSGVASADSEDYGNAFQAFDRNYATFWHTGSGYPHWIKYVFPQKEIVRSYSIQARSTGNCITEWKLQGYNGATWDDLDTRTGESFGASQINYYDVASPNAYTDYRILATAGNYSGYAVISQLNFYTTIGGVTNSVPFMTANNAPSPLIASASSEAGGYEAYKVFKDNNQNYGDGWSVSSGKTGWIKIDLGSGNSKAFNSYSIRSFNDVNGARTVPKEWTLQGSTDDASWDTLDTKASITGWSINEERIFSFTNITPYRYYQIVITDNNGYTTLAIGKIRFDRIMAFSEASVIEEGTYALKIQCSSDSLNHNIHSAFSPIDASDKGEISFWMRSTRTGSNIKVGFMDSGGVITEVTPNIAVANTYQEVTIDISGIADADIDAIVKIIITVVNATVANTVYIDNIIAGEGGEPPAPSGELGLFFANG